MGSWWQDAVARSERPCARNSERASRFRKERERAVLNFLSEPLDSVGAYPAFQLVTERRSRPKETPEAILSTEAALSDGPCRLVLGDGGFPIQIGGVPIQYVL
jgi:hypothetical protein